MSKHNKGKEMFSKNMSMIMIFIRASLGKTTLGLISCHKLNNCNLEFQFGMLKKIIKNQYFCHFTSFVVTM